jgi:N6-L-threonylcarbamoyladenine synthase
LAAGRDIFPCVGFVVSGGHTVLFHCHSALKFELLGTTRDDAAGEAFDKVASILGLPFPGGPAIEREAAHGNPAAFRFPRSMLEPGSLDFSFSGLKTAVLYAVRGQNRAEPAEPPIGQHRADLAASFQAAVVDVLVRKAGLALRQSGLRTLALGGGVSANMVLRKGLEEMCRAAGVDLIVPPLEYCTDNAAMAALAVEKWKHQEFAPLDLDAEPSLR